MRAFLAVAALSALALTGCLGSAGTTDAVIEQDGLLPPGSHFAFGFQTYQGSTDDPLWGGPVPRALPDPITGLEARAEVPGSDPGGGIAVFGPYAYIGDRMNGPLQIVDISDPEAPSIVGEVPDVPVRDADTIAFPADAEHPAGRLVVITTAGGKNMFATDVTDPATARMLGQFETEHGNHNIAVVPGTPIVYNSGGAGVIDIVDFSDPEAPVQTGTFRNDQGCHDITFFISDAKQRAYCAAYGESQVWDIADPLAPQMVVRIPYPTMEEGLPVVGDALPGTTTMPPSFSHLAMVNHDASVLIVGDETGGGGINGCDVYADAPGGPVSGPSGNLWFYDLTDETDPVLHGHVSPSHIDALGGSCTAHFGRVLEDTDHLVMGFYAAGVVLVDFTDIDRPAIKDRLDQEGSIWDVWYHEGYLFTGDMARGMDVLVPV